MRAILYTFLAVALAAPAPAQRYKFQINTETEEGKVLQAAGRETDEARQIALYEQFLEKFPKHEGALYAWLQVQPLLLKAKQWDKTISAGEAILGLDPASAPSAYNALQACEQKNDADCVVTWANRTAAAAAKVIASAKPADEDEAEIWTREVDYAKQVTTRAEYSFYATSLRATDAKSVAALVEALEKLNPNSQYIAMAGPRYLVTMLQANEAARAQGFCERAADRDQANEDMLLFAANGSLSTSQNYDKAITYATKIITALPGKPAPEGVAAADWETKKKNMLGTAYWIAGTAHGVKGNWQESEKAMTEALAFVENNPAGKDLIPGVYFYLGMANYSIAKSTPKPDAARMAQAKKHFTACAAIDSPFQGQAKKNLAAMAAGK